MSGGYERLSADVDLELTVFDVPLRRSAALDFDAGNGHGS
jgi:hypothetical protein